MATYQTQTHRAIRKQKVDNKTRSQNTKHQHDQTLMLDNLGWKNAALKNFRFIL